MRGGQGLPPSGFYFLSTPLVPGNLQWLILPTAVPIAHSPCRWRSRGSCSASATALAKRPGTLNVAPRRTSQRWRNRSRACAGSLRHRRRLTKRSSRCSRGAWRILSRRSSKRSRRPSKQNKRPASPRATRATSNGSPQVRHDSDARAVAGLAQVRDTVTLALDTSPDPQSPWHQGLEGILRQIDDQLELSGAQLHGERGEAFDPRLHEAIGLVPGAVPKPDRLGGAKGRGV